MASAPSAPSPAASAMRPSVMGSTLEDLLFRRDEDAAREIAQFEQFCEAEYAEENLQFCRAVKRYKGIEDARGRQQEGRGIVATFLSKNAPRELCVPPAAAARAKAMLEDGMRRDAFDEVHQHVVAAMEADSFRRYAQAHEAPAAAAGGQSGPRRSLGGRRGAVPTRALRARAESLRPSADKRDSASNSSADSRTSSGGDAPAYGPQRVLDAPSAATAAVAATTRTRMSLLRRASSAAVRAGKVKFQHNDAHLRADALKVGFLMKRGGRNPTWKRRWFSLVPDGLGYYEDDHHSGPKGFIPFREVTEWVPEAEAEVGRALTFALRVTGRTFAFQCASARDKARWNDALSPFLASRRVGGAQPGT